jgi:autotransporter-associated beta strand protein
LGAGAGYLNDNINASQTYGGVISGSGSLTKIGGGGGTGGTLTLTGANTYTGATAVNQGILAIGAGGSIHDSSGFSIAAGGTLDVSAQSSWSFRGNILANGTGTVVGGSAATFKGPSNTIVSTGTGAITLVYTPSTTNGDSLHPALYVSQGSLSMSSNTTIVISNASSSPMGVGTYILIQHANGGISNAPNPIPQIEGAGVSAGTTNHVVATNQYLFLVVGHLTTTTLSPLGSSSYGQSVTFTATISPTPSGGTVQFYDNGIPLGNTVAVSSGTASLTTGALAAGHHTITALYNGVTLYGASLSAPAIQQVAALPLSVTANSLGKNFGQTFIVGPGNTNFTSSGLEPGDTIGSVTLTVSSNGASAGAPVGTYVITPSAATGGTFSTNNYNITYNPGTLTITLPPNSSPVTITGPFVQSDGTVQLSFAGVPGYTYYIQAAADIDPPIDWANISTNTADTNGLFNFIDLDATNYPVRFYRTQVQP